MFFKMRQIDCKAHKINIGTMKEMKTYLFLRNKQNLKLNFQDKKDINKTISKKTMIFIIIYRATNNR